jgi:predicted ATPase
MNGHQAQQSLSPGEGLFVRLFGGPVLLRDGVPLSLSAYQGHLLALIYGNGSDGISREDAAWLLWESEDSPKARHRVSQLLYGLRSRVGEPVIKESDTQVLRGSLSNDLGEVLAAINAGALPKDLVLDGAYLSSLEPPTVEMAHWIDARRATLNGQIRDSLQHIIQIARARVDWGRVREASRTLVTVDGSNEQALESLVEAMTLGGEAQAVASEVSAHAMRYRTRTGCEWRPSETLRTMLQRAERFAEAPTKSGIPPFLGRSVELQQLMKVLNSRPTKPVFTILCGEAGIGKTRLASEALKQLVLKGYTTFECKASVLRREIPLSSVLSAFSHPSVWPLINQLDEPWRSSIIRLLPQLQDPDDTPPPIPLDPESAARRLMESLYQVLSVASSTAPTLLFLDDAQWMDVTTLTLLEFIADRSPPVGIHIVIGLRDEAVNEHVRSFIEFSRDRGHWIRLGPLDDASANLLLEATANRPLRPAEKERLRTTSGQNPFFLLELANDYFTRSAAQQDEQPVPESIRQLVAVRLELLSMAARTLLQYLSIVDSVDVLAPPAVQPLSSEFVDAADELLRARMIQHQGGTISIQHDLIRHAVYELMGPVKRAVLHIQAAEEAQSSPGTAAIHYDRAGIRDRAFEAAIRAAEATRAAGAVHEATQFFEIARRNADSLDEHRRSTEGLARLLYNARHLEKAALVLAESVDLAASPDEFRLMQLDSESELPGATQEKYLSAVDAIRARAMRDENWSLYADAVEVRLRMLERANALDEMRAQFIEILHVRDSIKSAAPEIMCSLNLILAISHFYSPEDDTGLSAALTATELADAHGLHSKRARAYSRLLLCYLVRGELQTPQGTATARAALSLATMSGDIRSRAMIYNNLGAYYLDTCQFKEAHELIDTALKTPCGPSERALLLVNWAEWHYWRGDKEVARRSFAEALTCAERQPILPMISVQTSAGLGLCALAEGRLSTAMIYEERVRRALSGWVHDPFLLVRFLAELERRRGNLDGAIQLIREHAARVQHIGYRIRGKLLEAEYVRGRDRVASDRLLEEAAGLARGRGLTHMLRD